MIDHNPELITLTVLALLIVVFLPQDVSPALLSQIIKVIGDNTWPVVILLLGLALIKAFGPKP